MIDRTIKQLLAAKLFKGKALLLVGPRQTGKTTLIKEVLKETGRPYRFFDGDDPTVRQLLDQPNTEQLRHLLGTSPIVFIDEAQRIPNLGLTAKIITDQFPKKQLILSGSSAFELSGNIQEPLTGRKRTYELFPISWEEWQGHTGYLEAEQDLENRLIYGFYPDVLMHREEQQELLIELVESYLYKDVLIYSGIRKPEVIQKLVQSLAWQVGNEVAYREVGELTGLDPKTIGKYIDILEKAYVLFRLPAFSRNLRNEIKTNRKIYFYDNGVRNAVIHVFQPIKGRKDVGALWENFLISERVKHLRYKKIPAQMYFWRTKQQQEIDYVEVNQGKLSAFEFKWRKGAKIRFPSTFAKAYKATMTGIDRENFRGFIMPQ